MSNEESYCNIDRSNRNIGVYIGILASVYIFCITISVINGYYLYKFYKRSNEYDIQNRHPKLVYYLASFSLFINIVLTPLACEFWSIECVSNVGTIRDNNDITKSATMEYLLISLYIILLFAYACIILLRVWLLRYDYDKSLASKNQIWMVDLGVSSKHDWWLKHSKTLGKESFMLKLIIFPWFICSVISISVSPINPKINGWTVMVLCVTAFLGIILVLIIINIWKVRSIHDNFNIKDEIFFLSKSAVFIGIFQLIYFVVGRIVDSELYDKTSVLVFALNVTLWLSAFGYSQTGYVFRLIHRSNTFKEQLVKNTNIDWDNEMNLAILLSDKNGFELFMNFLVSEYSTENLLCYIECTHLLHKWRKVLDNLEGVTLDFGDNNEFQPQNGGINEYHPKIQDSIKKVHTSILNGDSDRNDAVIITDMFTGLSIINKFKWINSTPIMKRFDISLWDHFTYIQYKYIDSNSNYQVNIKGRLYKDYRTILLKDCDLNTIKFNWENENDIDSGGYYTDMESPRSQPDRGTPMKLIEIVKLNSASHTKSNNNNKHNIIKSSSRNIKNLNGPLKVLALIEETRRQLWKLMQDSFIRFKSKQEYIEYLKSINQENIGRKKSQIN